jgi:hypothetical protein
VNSAPSTFGWLKAGGIFLACLLAIFLLPIIAIYGHAFLPWELPDICFFFPQLAFPYDSVVIREPSGSKLIFSSTVAVVLSLFQWGLLTIGFSWFARRLKVGYMILIAAVVIACVTYGVAYGITLFGATVELDGP